MGTLAEVWSGRAGLAKTYWGWGVAGSIGWAVIISGVKPGSAMAWVAATVFIAYFIAVNVGVWRAANQYLGQKVWAILAKLAVASFPIFLVLGTASTLVLTAKTQRPTQATSPSVAPVNQAGEFDPSTARPLERAAQEAVAPSSPPINWSDYTPVPASAESSSLAPSLEAAAQWTQVNTGANLKGPLLYQLPSGSRFCRMSDGMIVVVFPPGVRPQAEMANPFCANMSVSHPDQLPDEPDWWKKNATPVN
jgi:hypothetical protein